MSPLPHRGEPDPASSDFELLSAWMDGELDQAQARELMERLRGDPSLRSRFEWLQVASDALRSHEVAACHLPELTNKVGQALRSEPALLAPRALAASALRRHVATGMTLAAAAALLAVVALPQLRGAGETQPPAPAVAVGGNPPGPTTVRLAQPLMARDSQLEAYFRAHRELEYNGVMPAAAAYIRSSGEPDR